MPGQWDDWLILLHTPGIGPVRYGGLLQRFGSPAAALQASRSELLEAGLSDASIGWLRAPDLKTLQPDLAWLQADGHHLVSIRDARYPPLLARIPAPPPLLFVTGDPGLLSRPQLAIVGSRNPTSGGSRNARQFARFLAAAGLAVTSGLAVGIDAAAHEGALAAGATIAVSGTGPDRIYPAVNRELAHRIAVRGALVTEFPPGTGVRREHFPRRNRIISGLSLGVLVVEAAARSGSLITARLAAEHGREVFAIPGSIHSPLARGCHALIRQGAKLVETGNDVIEELAPLLGSLTVARKTGLPDTDAQPMAPLDNDYQTLLKCMGHDPVTPDALIQCSGLPPDVVSSSLLMLELEGYVASVPGGRYCRTEKTAADIT
jgi:DNA processing protein